MPATRRRRSCWSDSALAEGNQLLAVGAADVGAEAVYLVRRHRTAHPLRREPRRACDGDDYSLRADLEAVAIDAEGVERSGGNGDALPPREAELGPLVAVAARRVLAADARRPAPAYHDPRRV